MNNNSIIEIIFTGIIGIITILGVILVIYYNRPTIQDTNYKSNINKIGKK